MVEGADGQNHADGFTEGEREAVLCAWCPLHVDLFTFASERRVGARFQGHRRPGCFNLGVFQGFAAFGRDEHGQLIPVVSKRSRDVPEDFGALPRRCLAPEPVLGSPGRTQSVIKGVFVREFDLAKRLPIVRTYHGSVGGTGRGVPR